jgi:hypothetical protein
MSPQTGAKEVLAGERERRSSSSVDLLRSLPLDEIDNDLATSPPRNASSIGSEVTDDAAADDDAITAAIQEESELMKDAEVYKRQVVDNLYIGTNDSHISHQSHLAQIRQQRAVQQACF